MKPKGCDAMAIKMNYDAINQKLQSGVFYDNDK